MQSQENSPIKKIIVISISAAFILFAVYFFFFKKTAPVVVLDQFGNPTQAQVVGQDLVDLLDKLQNVKLDDSIFRNQAFINLTDYAITLPDQPRGRANPFAPMFQ
jgi:hypothetical protein